jgi:hypothetical protein
VPSMCPAWELPVVFTANRGQQKLLLKGSVLPESSCSQAHDQQQVPPAGLGSAVVVKSNETGCVYGVGCGWSTGWLIQATLGNWGGRGRRVNRSGCSV